MGASRLPDELSCIQVPTALQPRIALWLDVPHRLRLLATTCPAAAGSLSDPAVLDPATHGHGRWCLEVVQALGLLPDADNRGSSSDAAGSAHDAPQQTRPPALPPFHAGVSIGADMVLDLAAVAPGAIRAAALVVPGRLQRSGAAAIPAGLLLRFALYRLLPCPCTERLMLSCIFDEPAAGDPLVEQVRLGIRCAGWAASCGKCSCCSPAASPQSMGSLQAVSPLCMPALGCNTRLPPQLLPIPLQTLQAPAAVPHAPSATHRRAAAQARGPGVLGCRRKGRVGPRAGRCCTCSCGVGPRPAGGTAAAGRPPRTQPAAHAAGHRAHCRIF